MELTFEKNCAIFGILGIKQSSKCRKCSNFIRRGFEGDIPEKFGSKLGMSITVHDNRKCQDCMIVTVLNKEQGG